jgi:hypothetical protein
MDTLENAQKRAEYWKAEHLAGNAEIERLRELIRAHVTASNNDDTAGDTFGALLAEVAEVKKRKQFVYFENQESGMGVFTASESNDFKHLYGWMCESCRPEDLELLAWMEKAAVGEMHDHRLGYLVRLKDA